MLLLYCESCNEILFIRDPDGVDHVRANAQTRGWTETDVGWLCREHSGQAGSERGRARPGWDRKVRRAQLVR
jgi:hypothetical protein